MFGGYKPETGASADLYVLDMTTWVRSMLHVCAYVCQCVYACTLCVSVRMHVCVSVCVCMYVSGAYVCMCVIWC